MASRCAALNSLRSALVSLLCRRRRLASAPVIGAGATGPRRLASRFGVGRPFGAVVLPGEVGSVASSTASLDSSAVTFFRPRRFTSPGYFGTTAGAAGAWPGSALFCTNDGHGDLVRV